MTDTVMATVVLVMETVTFTHTAKVTCGVEQTTVKLFLRIRTKKKSLTQWMTVVMIQVIRMKASPILRNTTKQKM